MINKDDITVLIQGPLDKTSLRAIPDYLKVAGHIIIVTWDCSAEKAFELIKESAFLDVSPERDKKLVVDLNRIKFFSRPLPDYKKMIKEGKLQGVSKDTTFYWQIKGLSNGVNVCETPYIIRTRSDEHYKNLQPLINKATKNNFKFTCGNIFFKSSNDKAGPLHIGDHLYFSKTSILKKALDSILDAQHGKLHPHPYIQREAFKDGWCAEQILGRAILYAHDYDLEKVMEHNHYETVVNTFDIIDINELKPIHWSWKAASKSWTDFPPLYEDTIQDIKQY
tara:strand:- start:3139 stop:3978 length:840 start_codon:yes stop_codon:yes gene_type:complete